MAINEFSPPRVVKIAEDQVTKDSYRMARPIKFDGVLLNKGDAVEFNDPEVLKSFIKNNYI